MDLIFREQFTQTLITLEDIESLIHGDFPQNKLFLDVDCYSESQRTEDELCKNSHITAENMQMCLTKMQCENIDTYTRDNNTVIENIGTYTCDNNIIEQIQTKRNTAEIEEDNTSTENIDRKSEAEIHSNDTSKHSLSVTNANNCAAKNNTCSRRMGLRTRLNMLPIDSEMTASGLHNSSIIRHKRSDQDVNITCRYCIKQFASKKSLHAHVWIHEKNKEYSCEKCGKSFLRPNELCVHARTHTGERPFACKFCGKSFSSSSALKRHWQVHGADKTAADTTSANVCHLCGKGFSQKGNLTVHMKIHSGRYDHVCLTCQKSFITSGDLKRHARVHSREKPYTCDQCKKSFSASSTLVCHMRSHSGERPYLCGVCGAAFSILGHLKQHNKIHARGDLWPKKKGAVVKSSENCRTKKPELAGKEKASKARKKYEGSTRNVVNTLKYISVKTGGLQQCDMPDNSGFVSSVTQSGNSNHWNELADGTKDVASSNMQHCDMSYASEFIHSFTLSRKNDDPLSELVDGKDEIASSSRQTTETSDTSEFVSCVTISEHSNPLIDLASGAESGIKLEKGSSSVTGFMQGIQFSFSNSRNICESGVVSAALASENIEAGTTVSNVTDSCDAGIQPSGHEISENFRMVPVTIVSSAVNSHDLVTTESSYSLYQAAEDFVRPGIISNQICLPLTSVVNKHILITTSHSQDSTKREHSLPANILSVLDQRLEHIPASFCVEMGSSVDSRICLTPGNNNATVVSVSPAYSSTLGSVLSTISK